MEEVMEIDQVSIISSIAMDCLDMNELGQDATANIARKSYAQV